MARFTYTVTTGQATMTREDLTAQITGSAQTFTISAAYSSGTIRLYWNGIRQRAGDSFTEATSTTITTVFTPQIGDTLTLDYTPS